MIKPQFASVARSHSFIANALVILGTRVCRTYKAESSGSGCIDVDQKTGGPKSTTGKLGCKVAVSGDARAFGWGGTYEPGSCNIDLLTGEWGCSGIPLPSF